ncbi:MAG: sodium-translocating pyrophosphatase [Candidatus Omnitrophica bacterium]|nr:sodium-translocating pyrophosphatase [Candidatus Omnitrophota bacterium]
MFIWIISVSFVGLLTAALIAGYVSRQAKGTPEMREISVAIKEGAIAFLKRQYGTIAKLTFIFAVVILLIYAVTGELSFGLHTALAFILGALCSSVAGFIGMYISVRSGDRTAMAITRSTNRALKICLRGGAVSAILVVSLSLLGIAGIFSLFGGFTNPQITPLMIVGFGFGASFVALFAQLGGGIYTKAADVGADLVGKIEAGIPEDDPRNPAVIADLVGDNVGDCAGRGADLFESTVAENIGAMILGIPLYQVFGLNSILFPLVTCSFGLLASIAGIMSVRIDEDEDPMHGLNRGYLCTTILSTIGFAIATYLFFTHYWFDFFLAGLIGILTSQAFVHITQYYTEDKYRPVKDIVRGSEVGVGTNIITGFSIGLESTGLSVFVILIALFLSYYLGKATGLQNGGLYGTAVATMGMLSPCAFILAMDTFGPIADNAGGIVAMSHSPKEIRKKIDRFDAVGNTTKALTKGYAVGSAALAAFLLFSAYMESAHLKVINLGKPIVFVGGFLGAGLVFVFASLAIRAVGRAAYYIINDAKKQFRENPGIMKGTEKPDYAETVDICTRGALKEMILPGLIAIIVPIAVGFFLGTESVGATLMVGTIAGVMLALSLNNGGGSWDNAKKYIEKVEFGDKSSNAHKAAVVGDTVGDPFKDTAGPSLHILIKLLATLTLVFSNLFIIIHH